MIVKWLNKSKKWLITLTLLLLLAISSIVALVCYQPDRLQLQQQLSQQLHYPVKIQSVMLRWRHFQPYLYLSKISIESQDKPLAVVKGVNLTVNIEQSLLHRSWRLSNIRVQNVSIHTIPQLTKGNGALPGASLNWKSLYF